MSGHVRRIALIGTVSLVLCAPAHAGGLPVHSGRPVLPGAQTVQDLRTYPRTLMELNRAPTGGLAFGLHEAGARLISPQLAL